MRLAILYQKSLAQPHDALRCLDDLLRLYPHGSAAAWARQARAYLQAHQQPAPNRRAGAAA